MPICKPSKPGGPDIVITDVAPVFQIGGEYETVELVDEDVVIVEKA